MLFNQQSEIRNQKSPHGFTLVELLVVISIIALLLGILLPSLNRALRLAKGTQCTSQIHQMMTNCAMYAAEQDGFMPFPNSNGMESGSPPKWAGPGWLYDRAQTAHPDKPADARYGVLWSYLRSEKVYRCPLDKGPWTQVQNLTSYIMSSVVRGFDSFVSPSVQLAKFRGDALLMWEGNEKNGWNDGNDDPWSQTLSSRHDGHGSAAFADTHVELVGAETYGNWQNTDGPNPLWCNPLTPDGMRAIVPP
ncbi:MAG: prepilin-type N-terminal cleavage/methylation domain-containing protein [Phycisphaerales bacterium]